MIIHLPIIYQPEATHSNLKKRSVRLDIARNHFSNRVVSLCNGLPDRIIVKSSSPGLFKRALGGVDFSPSVKFYRNVRNVASYYPRY